MADKDVFVFGSNEAGRHGKGAARDARELYGAVPGRGSGIQGRGLYGISFAIPTKDRFLKPLSYAAIQPGVDSFLKYAIDHPEKNCLVSRVGCGYAGKLDHLMAAMFAGAPNNCGFDPLWLEFGLKTWNHKPASLLGA